MWKSGQRWGNILTLIDPNGCVWSGDYRDVIAMYSAFAKEMGFAGWFNDATFIVCRINGAAASYISDALPLLPDLITIIQEYL